MRVLVVGTLPQGIRRAEERLLDAGYDVVRCHEPGDTSFPCAGLVEGRGCPLDDEPVDVVVTARNRPWPRPSPFEDGAICALRRYAPLVVMGTALHPFEPWVTHGVDDDADLLAACEAAAAAPLERHGEVATDTARQVLELAGFDSSAMSATVRHQRGGLLVELSIPPDAAGVQGYAVASILTALRELDPYATGIDVSIASVEA